MPAATNISINDATPTAHVFVPVGKVGEAIIYRNTAGAVISAGEESLALSMNRASGSRSTDKVKISFAYPCVDTIDGVETIRCVGRFNGEWTIPDVMTDGERTDFERIVANGFDATDVKAYVKDLVPTW